MTGLLELAEQIGAAIERFHDSLPQGQGETGDGPEAGKALCQLFYDNSDTILDALRAHAAIQSTTNEGEG